MKRLTLYIVLAVLIITARASAQVIFDPAPTFIGSATVAGHITPSISNTFDVGSVAATFRNIFAGSTIVGPGIGPSTTQQHTLPAVSSDTVALVNATQTLANKTLGNSVTMAQGTGSGSASLSGVGATGTTVAPTTGTVKQTLATYTLPQNSFSANGKGIRIRAWGVTAANGNSKTLGIDFGATTVGTITSTANNGVVRVEALVIRSAAAQEEAVGEGRDSGATTSLTRTTPAEDNTAGTVAVNIFGTTPTAAGDVSLTGYLVEVLN